MEPTQSSSSPNKAIIGIIVIALLVAAATVAVVLSAGNENTDTESVASTSPSPTTESTASASSESESGDYKDGTYTATGSYQTPGGRESIGVTITLASDGTISDSSLQLSTSGGETQQFQSKFASGYKSQVVGKRIDEVSLSRVAGSSLTSRGFNSAIEDIETQAKA